jgi:thymidylate synthase (FAD)
MAVSICKPAAAESVELDCIADSPGLHSHWPNAVAPACQAYVKLVEGLTNTFKDESDRTLRRKMAHRASRSAMPNATETIIFCTASGRALRRFVEMRASRHAETEVRPFAGQVLQNMQHEATNLFPDSTLVSLAGGTFVAATPHRKV